MTRRQLNDLARELGMSESRILDYQEGRRRDVAPWVLRRIAEVEATSETAQAGSRPDTEDTSPTRSSASVQTRGGRRRTEGRLVTALVADDLNAPRIPEIAGWGAGAK